MGLGSGNLEGTWRCNKTCNEKYFLILTLHNMMDNPLVQSLMSNPDYMRQIVTSNQQMHQLLEVSNLRYKLWKCDSNNILNNAASPNNQPCNEQSRIVETNNGMEQIVDNPQLMQSLMNAPYAQSMF